MIACDPSAAKHAECAACKLDWPVHVDSATGERFHLDVMATNDYGIMVKCPTSHWYEEDDDNPGTSEEESGVQS